MTLQELIDNAGRYAEIVMFVFSAPPALALLLLPFRKRAVAPRPPLSYLYSVLIYFTCVPGVFAAVLTAYAVFFTRSSLLEVSLLVYLLPTASMIATLILLARSVRFDDIPGFDHLSGLIILIGLSFLVVLIISKTRIWLLFGGSIWLFFGLAVVVFFALKLAARKTLHGR